MLKKPEVSEVYDFLSRHNALIVHFSGAPKGAGVDRSSDHLFPTDLQHVSAGRAMGGVSCSVVRPGDIFYGYKRNATGCIGTTLGLRSKESLVAVNSSDCGSIEDESGIRTVQNPLDIACEDLDKTLNERKEYNEWIVQDYEVFGIFFARPCEVSVMRVPKYSEEMPEYLCDNNPVPDIRIVLPSELPKMFPRLSIYTFSDDRILQYDGNGCTSIDHSSIYPRR